MTTLRIGICGGGIGGLAAAVALRQSGHEVHVFERAGAQGRVGADVNLTPNAGHALTALGVIDRLRPLGACPTHRISRDGISGAETSRLELGRTAEDTYGAPQMTIHRADLIAAFTDALPDGSITLGRKVAGIAQDEAAAEILFEDGTRAGFDAVIGADGIHSAVRLALHGPDDPRFTGLVSWRAVVPRSAVAHLPDIDAFTKWWGPTPDRQIVVFPLTRGEEVFIFATTPQTDWTEEGWTLPGDPDELRAAYTDFHAEAQGFLAAIQTVTRSALYVRDPMPVWSVGRVTVMGDAAHPMVPFMAQGACMAIEDAVVLGRALAGVSSDDVPAALALYQTTRRDRTADIQRGSLANTFMKGPSVADWVYGYRASDVPLGQPADRAPVVEPA